MAFLTPCFVRVEDAAERKKLIEWLEEIGYEYVQPPKEEVLGNKVICESSYFGTAHDEQTFSTAEYIDADTSVELFRALAAMNDENDREQWFVGDNGEYVKCTDNIFLMYAINVLQKQKRKTGFIAYHKATVEEIIKYFKKRGK